MMTAALSLSRLLKPRSVVIVGASDKPGALGASVLGNLDRMGFGGDIHLINPNREEIGGRPCLKTIDDLPDDVDCAVLAIPRAGVLDAVRALAARGVGAAIIFSAGFAEGGEQGLAEQAEIARIAAGAGMVIEGPNCLGFVNFVDGVPLTFIETAPTRLGDGPGIGIVSQSGAIAAVVDTSLLSRDLGLSYSISTGNEAGSGVEDFVDFLVDDPSTSVIGMIVEQFRRPQRFLKAAARARDAGKVIVLLHPGRSAAARASAATHTGAMAGDWPLMRAKVTHAGVIFVDTLEELGDCIELVARGGRVGPGGSIVIGESGAFKALTLDFAEDIGLRLPLATDADSPALRAALPDFVPVSNPVDMTAQGLVDPSLYTRLIDAALADERFDSIVLGIIQTDAATCAIKFSAILPALASARGSKAIICAGLDQGAAIPDDYVMEMRALGVPYYPSTERAFRAVARLAEHARRDDEAIVREAEPIDGLKSGVVPEYRAKALLGPYGIDFPQSRLATTIEHAVAAAVAIGYPVVLKAQSAALSHKSDVGGVIVGLSDAASLAAGWERLHANIARHRPGLEMGGVLVEAMGQGGVEMIVGGRNDPEWGPIILVGFGGVQAELTKDVRLVSADLPRHEIKAEIARLKGAALLQGFRGDGLRDIDAVATIVERVSALLTANPYISEIDLNPVIVHPEGRGAVALDALMTIDQR